MPSTPSRKKRRAEEEANEESKKSQKQLKKQNTTTTAKAAPAAAKATRRGGSAAVPPPAAPKSASRSMRSAVSDEPDNNSKNEDELDQKPPSIMTSTTPLKKAAAAPTKSKSTNKPTRKAESKQTTTSNAETKEEGASEISSEQRYPMNFDTLFSFFLLFLIFINIAGKFSPLSKKVVVEERKFPLIGMGVGNLQHDRIESQISQAILDDMDYRLVDTAHASNNEHLVLSGIRRGILFLKDKDEIHVVTKVAYTHLGYERTKLSVMESLRNLNHPNVKIHMLIHWPRCNESIPWMNCEQDEYDLPDYVKEAGPPPHLDKDHAFKESWRALEDIYLNKISLGDLPSLTSIGVSNFALDDLKDLMKDARIKPHFLQGNVWSYLFDPYLMNYCRENGIYFQAYNVMNGIHDRQNDAPNAYYSLIMTANKLSAEQDDQLASITPAQVILKWLVQNNVGVIPRTSQLMHLEENSALSLEAIPTLTGAQDVKVELAVRALLTGQDLSSPTATFVNGSSEQVYVFWKGNDGVEMPVRDDFAAGETFATMTYPGHVFVVYDDTKTKRKEFVITAGFGESQLVPIEELL